ncbi:MAG: class I SAM-dependent methyltransferase [SAR202 cluster bacterium]|nr:class I SAM-dependent methyltransferase [SAR202 cluster bacterium]
MPGRERAFDEYVERYEAWYDSARGAALLATEVACLRPLLARYPKPWLEVGIGSGRFGQALGIQHGVDLSLPSLKLAWTRGVRVARGTGEALPYRDGAFGCVLMAFTLCFVSRPEAALREARRVLGDGGGLVLGLLLRGSPWADDYARRGREGHPVYRDAVFHSREEVEALTAEAGFRLEGYRSTLFQSPGLERYAVEEAVEGFAAGAGFACLAARKG